MPSVPGGKSMCDGKPGAFVRPDAPQRMLLLVAATGGFVLAFLPIVGVAVLMASWPQDDHGEPGLGLAVVLGLLAIVVYAPLLVLAPLVVVRLRQHAASTGAAALVLVGLAGLTWRAATLPDWLVGSVPGNGREILLWAGAGSVALVLSWPGAFGLMALDGGLLWGVIVTFRKQNQARTTPAPPLAPP